MINARRLAHVWSSFSSSLLLFALVLRAYLDGQKSRHGGTVFKRSGWEGLTKRGGQWR